MYVLTPFRAPLAAKRRSEVYYPFKVLNTTPVYNMLKILKKVLLGCISPVTKNRT